jgi:hypothetical protein
MALAKNPNTIIAEIKLLNTSGQKSFILVEGQFDYIFWRNKKSCQNVEVIDCQGRGNVEAVSWENRTKPLAKLLGITDRDFDFFELYPVLRHDDLVYTDYNDFETTMLSFGIAEKILSSFCNIEAMIQDKIFLNRPESIFRDSLFVGKIRFLSKRDRYNFTFQEKYPMGKYYNSAYDFDRERLLNDFSLYTEIDKSTIIYELSMIPEEPLWHMLRGHDCLLNLCNIIQKYKFCNFNPQNIKFDIQCMFTTEHLHSCDLYKDIKKWEHVNNCVLIL